MDPKIDADRQKVASLRAQVQHHREAAHAAGIEARHERAAARKDARHLHHDKAAVHHARAQAKKDLEPAEFKMGLHATNEARHALGLPAVDHVIRPDQKLDKAVKRSEEHTSELQS